MVPFRASYDHLFVRFVTNAIQSVMCRYCSVSPHSRYSIQFQPSNRTFVQARWTERCICTTWLVKTEPLVPSPLSYLIQSAAILGDFYYTFFVMSSCVFLVQMAGISIKRLPHRGYAKFLRFRFFFFGDLSLLPIRLHTYGRVLTTRVLSFFLTFFTRNRYRSHMRYR